jgi:hypothetical protein
LPEFQQGSDRVGATVGFAPHDPTKAARAGDFLKLPNDQAVEIGRQISI